MNNSIVNQNFPQGMKIAHLNVRGLTTKFDEIKSILYSNSYDIFCLSETFLNSNKPSSFFNIHNYQMIRKDRDNGKGGGLLCFIHHTILFENLISLNPVVPESISFKISQPHSQPFITSFMYRPPDTLIDWNQIFKQHVEQLSIICNEILIMGDFNIDLKHTSSNRWLRNIVKPLSLKQIIDEPTREVENTATLIDHIYTNSPQNISCSYVQKYALSDHYLIMAIRKKGVIKSKERIKKKFNDYSRFTNENICNIFSKIDWNNILCHQDIDVIIDKFNQTFLSLTNKLIVQRTRFVKTETLPDWIDEDVRRHMKIRDKFKFQKKWGEYKSERNLVNHLIKKKKKEHMTKLVESSKNYDTKRLWNALNIKNNKNIKQVGESDLSSDTLNEHFTTIASKLSKDQQFSSEISCNSQMTHQSFSQFPRFTPLILKKILNSISVSKSTGPDNISVRMLRKTFPFICNVITDIFNRILQEGKFPKMWKIARVTPIFKSGQKTNPSNYRPISVLPILSKIFEKHLNFHAQKFLSKYKLISPNQSGFRNGYSCTDAVHKIISDSLSQKQKHNKVLMLFIDFSKAFDCVDHEILIDKLKRLKFNNKALTIMTSFLQNRSQYVHFGGTSSSMRDINVGVPQGSILAPTFFQIYINDLLYLKLYSTSYAYADDTVFITSNSNPSILNQTCERDLVSINNWCIKNKMSINFDKSHFLLSGGDCAKVNLKVGNKEIKRKKETKLLGFTITDSLSLNQNCISILEKVTKNTNLLKLCRPYLTTYSSKLFYYQFIHCHLIYGIYIYFNLTTLNVNAPIFLQQKRALRIIANMRHIPYYLTSTNQLCIKLNILPLPSLCKYFSCIAGFKALNYILPDYISNFFVFPNHRFPKRDVNLLKVPSDKLNFILSTTFNSLPIQLRSMKHIKSFKDKLRNYIFENL